jgi:tyrosyl-tRNA synthetase
MISSVMTIDEQIAYLTKGCVDVVRPVDLRVKLERAEKTGKKLTVKVGFDPTAPDLHLGHTVLIRKMKHFQDLGHTVVYVVGSFTALIGDPSGRSKTRPPLTMEEISANAETYKTQIFKILDPQKTVTRFNSEWLEPLGSAGWIRLAAKYNVAQMLERREFRQRYDAGKPIAIHEFLYPLAQAYDSVVLNADVELGGTDQLFNLNVGRDLMPAFELEPQIVMTTPLLEGLDGVEKMSKSLGNYVGVMESAPEMFGKLMSISDELMWKYYALLTDLSAADIQERRDRVSAGALHPKTAKVALATLIVSDFHSAAAAAAAAGAFEQRFAKGEIDRSSLEVREWVLPEEPRAFRQVLIQLKLSASGAEADQKLKQGAVKVDGRKISGPFELQSAFLRRGQEHVVEIGRRAFLLRVR